MIDHVFDPGHRLGGDFQCLAHGRRLGDAPIVNHTVHHHDIEMGEVGPVLAFQGLDHFFAQRTIVAGRRLPHLLALGGQRLQQVGAADDADHGAIIDHRHPLDLLALQRLRNLPRRRVRRHRHHFGGHDLFGLHGVGLDELLGQMHLAADRHQPPRRIIAGADLRTADQVALAD